MHRKHYILKLNLIPKNSKYAEFLSMAEKLAWANQTRPNVSYEVAI